MDPIVSLEGMEQIAAGIDHAEGICVPPDGLAFATDGSVLMGCHRPDIIHRWRADLGLVVARLFYPTREQLGG